MHAGINHTTSCLMPHHSLNELNLLGKQVTYNESILFDGFPFSFTLAAWTWATGTLCPLVQWLVPLCWWTVFRFWRIMPLLVWYTFPLTILFVGPTRLWFTVRGVLSFWFTCSIGISTMLKFFNCFTVWRATSSPSFPGLFPLRFVSGCRLRVRGVLSPLSNTLFTSFTSSPIRFWSPLWPVAVSSHSLVSTLCFTVWWI